MPAPAVKAESPPVELTDRSEGWGRLGRVEGYPDYKDDGEWPIVIVRQEDFADYPTETLDGTWSHEILDA